MRVILALAIHLLVTFVKLLRPSGVRAVAAESRRPPIDPAIATSPK